MLLNFRHGIVSGSGFVQSSGSGLGIFATPSEPLVVSIAHKQQNILHTVNTSVSGAFGLTAPYPTKSWLFLDISDTGAISFGYTTVEPVVSPTQPSTLSDDLHWYDTTNFLMKVWRSAFSRFDVKTRIFIATVNAAGTPSYYGEGQSQISVTLPYPSFIAGRVLYDVSGKALHQSNKDFLLSSSDLFIGGMLNSGITIEKGTILARAVENMSANTIVKLQGVTNTSDDVPEVAIADYLDTRDYLIGYVSTDVTQGDTVPVSIQGAIVNPDWNWSSLSVPVGGDVWIGTGPNKGTPVVADPKDTDGLAPRPPVGNVLSTNSIYFFQPATVNVTEVTQESEPTGYQADAISADLVIDDQSQLNKSYFVDTSTGPITITFDYTDITLEPGKHWITFTDVNSTFDTNPLTVDPSPENVYGVSDSILWDVPNGTLTITYVDASRGFIVTESTS